MLILGRYIIKLTQDLSIIYFIVYDMGCQQYFPVLKSKLKGTTLKINNFYTYAIYSCLRTISYLDDKANY